MRRGAAHRQRVGFVPTMGARPDGHLTLVREARKHAISVVCSIFQPDPVGPNDFANTRATSRATSLLDGVDVRVRAGARCDNPKEMHARPCRWPHGAPLRSASSGHFEGVTTVVYLFGGQAVQCRLGKKRLPAARVLRRMSIDLLPGGGRGVPDRYAGGRSAGSRNLRISRQRAVARARFPSRRLRAAHEAFTKGEPRGYAPAAARSTRSGADRDVDDVTVATADLGSRSQRTQRRARSDARGGRLPGRCDQAHDKRGAREDPLNFNHRACRRRGGTSVVPARGVVRSAMTSDGPFHRSRRDGQERRRRRVSRSPPCRRPRLESTREPSDGPVGHACPAGADGTHGQPRWTVAGLDHDGAPLRRRPHGTTSSPTSSSRFLATGTAHRLRSL